MKRSGFRGLLAFLLACLFVITLPAHAARQTITTTQNLLLYSQVFGTAPATTYWVGDSSGSGVSPVITDNFAAAPDGTSTAARIQLNDGGSGFSRLTQSSSATFDPNQLYTMSLWVRSNDGTPHTAALRFGGTVANISVTTTWQRFSLQIPIGAVSASLAHQVLLWSAQSTDNTADLLIWGAQIVKANWAGPYTPTTSSMVNASAAIRNTP
jgi:hypothetical protein